jgi:hypothetical protein
VLSRPSIPAFDLAINSQQPQDLRTSPVYSKPVVVSQPLWANQAKSHLSGWIRLLSRRKWRVTLGNILTYDQEEDHATESWKAP